MFSPSFFNILICIFIIFCEGASCCSYKHISCLNESAYQFCFVSATKVFKISSVKYCPVGTICNENYGKYACIYESAVSSYRTESPPLDADITTKNDIFREKETTLATSTQDGSVLGETPSGGFTSYNIKIASGVWQPDALKDWIICGNLSLYADNTISEIFLEKKNTLMTVAQAFEGTEQNVALTTTTIPSSKSERLSHQKNTNNVNNGIKKRLRKKNNRNKGPTTDSKNKSNGNKTNGNNSPKKKNSNKKKPSTVKLMRNRNKIKKGNSRKKNNSKIEKPSTVKLKRNRNKIKQGNSRKKINTKNGLTRITNTTKNIDYATETFVTPVIDSTISKVIPSSSTTGPTEKSTTHGVFDPKLTSSVDITGDVTVQPITPNIRATVNYFSINVHQNITNKIQLPLVKSDENKLQPIEAYLDKLTNIFSTPASDIVGLNRITLSEAGPFTNNLETSTISAFESSGSNSSGTKQSIRCNRPMKYPSSHCNEYYECVPVMWWHLLMKKTCPLGERFDAATSKCTLDINCIGE